MHNRRTLSWVLLLALMAGEGALADTPAKSAAGGRPIPSAAASALAASASPQASPAAPGAPTLVAPPASAGAPAAVHVPAAAASAAAGVVPSVASAPAMPFRIVCPHCKAELAVTAPAAGGEQGKASLLAPPPAPETPPGDVHAQLPGASARPEPVLEGRMVRSRTSSYSVTLPGEDWSLHSHKDSPIGNADADAEMSSRAGGFAIVIAEDGAMNASTYAKLCLERTESAIQGFSIGAKSKLKIGGLEGVQATASGTLEGTKIRYLFTFVCGKQRCYQIVCWTAANLFDDLSKDFHALAESFAQTR